MQEALLLMTAAAGIMILMLAIILLVHKRMRRGEIVQATVHRVDLEDSDASDTIAVTLTYTFPWRTDISRRLCRSLHPINGSDPDISCLCPGGDRLFCLYSLDGQAAKPDLSGTDGIRYPPAGTGRISGIHPPARR